MIGEKQYKAAEERVCTLCAELIRSYRELIVEGPLESFFAVIEGGYSDAAKVLLPRVKESVIKFQDKITEVVSGSDYTVEGLYLLEDLQECIDIMRRLSSSQTGSEKTTEDEVRTDGAAESGTPG